MRPFPALLRLPAKGRTTATPRHVHPSTKGRTRLRRFANRHHPPRLQIDYGFAKGRIRLRRFANRHHLLGVELCVELSRDEINLQTDNRKEVGLASEPPRKCEPTIGKKSGSVQNLPERANRQ